MNALHPGLLVAGLLAVSIPIVIHLLFRRRRKPVEWAAMRFLIEAFRRKRRRLRLEHLILLAVRCLIIACLAIALGRPLLDAAGLIGASGRDVYLLVDNGVASSLRDASGRSALEAHQRRAQSLLASLNPGDRVGLIAMGSPAQPIVIPPSNDPAAVGRLVEALEPTDGATDVQGALGTLASYMESLEGDEDPRPSAAVVLSDFRSGSADLTRPLTDALGALEGVRLLAMEPTDTPAGNTQIVSVDPLRSVVLTGAGRAAEDVSVRVRLARTGSAIASAQTTSVRLRAVRPQDLGASDAREGARAAVRWTPGQSEASVTLSARLDRVDERGEGASLLVATIDRDDLEADNTFRTPVRITDALEVGVVGTRRLTGGASLAQRSAADWLRPALAPTEVAPIRPIDLEPGVLDRPTLAGLDAVLLTRPDLVPEEAWGALRAFVDDGGMLMVTPPADASVHLWTDPFVEAFALEWSFEREAEEAPEVRTIETDASTGGAAQDSAILSLLAEEMEPLTRPVGVFRTLTPDLGSGAGTSTLLGLDAGSSWLVATRTGSVPEPGAPVDNSPRGRGLLVYLASAPTLSWTDLPARPLMVPLVQELVRQGVGASSTGYALIAGRSIAPPGGTSSLERVTTGEDSPRIDVDSSGMLEEPIRASGVWLARDRAGRARTAIALNADTRGARTALNTPEATKAWLGEAFGPGSDAETTIAWLDENDPGAALEAGERGSPFSLPLLVAALLLTLVETCLARWFAHAWREPSPRLVGAGA